MGVVHTEGAGYGWRARIGLLQPGSVSDTNPFEFYMMAPEGVQLVLTSLNVPSYSEQGYAQAIAGLEAPVQRLLPRKPDVMIQTGVPPLVHAGWGIEDELRERVAKVTSVPYISDAAASIAAMKAVGITKVLVVGTFQSPVRELIKTYLDHVGIDTAGYANPAEGTGLEAGLLTLEMIQQAAIDEFKKLGAQADGLWLTPASMPSVGVIAVLERELGVPVISSAQSLMWAGMRIAGIDDRIAGFGRLFDVQEFKR